MSVLSPSLTSALLTGSYTPLGDNGQLNVASSLFAAAGNSLSTANNNILSSAYTPTFTAEQATTLANAVDDTTLQAILQSTGYNTSTSLFNSLTGTSLYDSTVSLLQGQYLSSYSTEA